MIAASRRRRPGTASGEETFGLHQRIARRSTWSKRLMRGSLLALVASLVALFAGAAWLPHLLICVAGFVVGLALPLMSGQRAALATIREAAGLSYETALDIMSEAGQDQANPTASDDPYGFKSETIDRARDSVRDVRPQSPPAWWLPALAVALALLLVGMLESPGGVGVGGSGGPGGSPGASAPAGAADDDQSAQEDDLAAPLEPEAGRAQEPEGVGSDSAERAPDSPLVAPPAPGNDAAAPLSRFLDSLRERPEDHDDGEAGQPGAPSQPPDAPQPNREPGAEGGGERGDEPQRSQVNPFSSTEESGESAGEGSDPEDQASAGETADSGRSEAGADDEAGVQQGGAEPGEQQGEAQGEEGEAPGGQGGDQLDEGDSEFQGGGAEGEDSDSGEGGGAGAAGGSERSAGVAEGEQTPPDFLEGVLERGPENPAGAVRLPGDSDVVLPPGRSLGDYQNAAEDAITEGDIPLSYQEIIRRYFQ